MEIFSDSMRRISISCCFLVLWGGAVSAQRKAHFEAYDEGLTAIAERRLSLGVQKIREAIALDGQEKLKRRTGAFRGIGSKKSYLPHYYLGVALSQLDECEEALESLDTSWNQRVIRTMEEGAGLTTIQGRCRWSLAHQAVAEVYRRAKPPKERFDELLEEADLAAFWRTDLTARENVHRALDTISGYDYLEDPSPDQLESVTAADFIQGGSALEDAIELLGKAEVRIEGYRDRVASEAPLNDALRELMNAEREAKAILASTKGVGSQESRSCREQLSAIVEGRRDESSVEVMVARRDAVLENVDCIRTAQVDRPGKRGQPRVLRTAARHLFLGEYEDVLSSLEDFSLEAGQQTALARLFLGAARFTLDITLERMRSDESLDLDHEQARAEIKACLEADPELYPDPSFFSPRFVRFFDEVRSVYQEPATLVAAREE